MMYQAKKFSTTNLVPHKTQGSEPVAVVAPVEEATTKGTTSSPPAGNSKQRLRWTSDLHDRFVDAIAQLGGPDSGSNSKRRSKGDGCFRTYHLSCQKSPAVLLSHSDLTCTYGIKIIANIARTETLSDVIVFDIQKYRLAKYLPESSVDGSKDEKRCSGDSVSSMDSPPGLQINEALRMQMEVQKRLHEQLEVQRQLQMRIEAQGKYLQKIIEEQQELSVTLKASDEEAFGEEQAPSAARKRLRTDAGSSEEQCSK